MILVDSNVIIDAHDRQSRFQASSAALIANAVGEEGAGVWLAALNVKYRDFRYVVPFIVQFGLYISPVGFSSNIVPEKWRAALRPQPNGRSDRRLPLGTLEGCNTVPAAEPRFIAAHSRLPACHRDLVLP